MSPRIVLAAGGTGGHLFPAEALARALVGRGAAPILVTDPRTSGFSAPIPGLAVHRLPLQPMRGGIVGRTRAAVGLAAGTVAAWRLLRRLRPDVVVGFGGYPSVPTVIAAARRGAPVLLHEQNAVLGKANRLLAGRARRIATAFPAVRLLDPALAGRVVETGNPVRPAIIAARGHGYAAPAGDGPIELLVTGGSQGARIFAEVVPAAIGRLPNALRDRLHVIQQARAEDVDRVRAAYRGLAMRATVERFFDDIPERLARAALVVARSGASTVAELAVAGRPSVLVPYRLAADDHQTDNARFLDAAGAAWLMPETGLTEAALAGRLEALLGDPSALAAAAARAHACGRPDAAERLADAALALAAPVQPLERAA
ncbi:MAG: undecaprenyldiphospho-muramoylpentapeptide beta-N-acetylglucosaminyltransferase [Alphaproteobacteria bacterium]